MDDFGYVFSVVTVMEQMTEVRKLANACDPSSQESKARRSGFKAIFSYLAKKRTAGQG